MFMRCAAALMTLPASLLVACGKDDGVLQAAEGRVSLAVADAPVDGAEQTVIRFTGVEMQSASGGTQSFSFDPPLAIDLLSLGPGDSATLLSEEPLPAGRYTSIRLLMDARQDGVMDSFVQLPDGPHELVIPEDASGLQAVSGNIEVAANAPTALTIDFDLRKSVQSPDDAQASHFALLPALRLLNNDDIGAIAGSVDAALMPEGCRAAVYVYAGSDATADDLGSGSAEPVSSHVVDADTRQYALDFLAPGSYTAALTCQAAADDPRSDDPIDFIDSRQAEVVAGGTTTLDFAPPP